LFANRVHPDYPLIMAANRDEFFERPTATAGFWDDVPDLLAGRDLRSGGAWLGVTRTGRIAAVTNFRRQHSIQQPAPSRGHLVQGFLQGQDEIEHYLTSCRNTGHAYEGYNLLVGHAGHIGYYTNHAEQFEVLEPGVHGLSNTFINAEDWPKVRKGSQQLAALLKSETPLSTEWLFMLMSNREPAPLDDISPSNLSPEAAAALSAMFISKTNNNYGTRCSTILMLHRNGMAHFAERTFSNEGQPLNTVYHNFQTVPYA
ncbi:MAG: NRDE family protein, partial [Pseudomonadota bacterium]